ncbi:hypothetical protein [Bradyrhizobium lablabi]|nr:hypothetical protein [Bradyrhizobium lablabi]
MKFSFSGQFAEANSAPVFNPGAAASGLTGTFVAAERFAPSKLFFSHWR